MVPTTQENIATDAVHSIEMETIDLIEEEVSSTAPNIATENHAAAASKRAMSKKAKWILIVAVVVIVVASTTIGLVVGLKESKEKDQTPDPTPGLPRFDPSKAQEDCCGLPFTNVTASLSEVPTFFSDMQIALTEHGNVIVNANNNRELFISSLLSAVKSFGKFAIQGSGKFVLVTTYLNNFFFYLTCAFERTIIFCSR